MPVIFRIRFEHSLLIATLFINSFRVHPCHYTVSTFKKLSLLCSLERQLDGKMNISNVYMRNDPGVFTNYGMRKYTWVP